MVKILHLSSKSCASYRIRGFWRRVWGYAIRYEGDERRQQAVTRKNRPAHRDATQRGGRAVYPPGAVLVLNEHVGWRSVAIHGSCHDRCSWGGNAGRSCGLHTSNAVRRRGRQARDSWAI